jgi:hypothetical protein
MQSVSIEDIANLSEEARVFRWLVRNYVACKLRESLMSVPASLQKDEGYETALPGHDATCQSNLSDAFTQVVDQFVAGSSSELCSMTAALPATRFSVEECVMRVIYNVLVYGDVTWGRMVAVAAFIAKVALRCVQNEVVDVVAPLIDHSPLLAEYKLSHYVRQNGSWSRFATAFQNIKKKKHSWLYNVITSLVRKYI